MRSRQTPMLAGTWLFAGLVPAMALSMGGLPISILLVGAVLAATSCVLVWLGRSARLTTPARCVLGGAVLLEVVTILQIVPLPAGMVRAVAPANAEIWEHALGPLHLPPPALMTLSIAPLAGRAEALRGLLYLCVLFAAIRIAAERDGTRFLERLVVASATAMALSALAHTAVNAQTVFGVYRPHEVYAYKTGRYSSLLNTNHLAAYLDMGAFVAVGALVARRTMPRALSLGAAILLAGTSVWAGSRGGTAALALGVVMTLVLGRLATKGFASRRIDLALLAVCAVAAAILVGTGLSDVAKTDLSSTDTSKLAIAREAFGLVRASPIFGFGRGSFESVFPLVRTSGTHYSFTHPENIVAQWTAEWGIPASLAALTLVGWGLQPMVVMRAARPIPGAWVAVAMTVMHDLVDFHLEVPGVVVLALTCTALVVSSKARLAAAEPEAAGLSRARLAAVASAIATVLAAIVNVPAMGRSLADERRVLSEAALDPNVDRVSFERMLRQSIELYPAESFFPLMAAVRAQLRGEGPVIVWIGSALKDSPHSGRSHFVLARYLAAGGYLAQARLEYRLAYVDDDQLRTVIEREARGVVDDFYAAMELVPDGGVGDDMLRAFVTSLSAVRPATSYRLDTELARRSPMDKDVARREVDRWLSDLQNEHPWCAKPRCGDGALAAAAAFRARDPRACDGALAVARTEIALGRIERGLDDLVSNIDGVDDRAVCQRAFVELAVSVGATDRADRELDRLVRSGCGHANDCYDLYIWAAGAEERRGNRARAGALYRQAVESGPAGDDILEHIVELDLQIGITGDAIKTLETLASRHPDESRYQKRIAELRARGLQRALPLPRGTD